MIEEPKMLVENFVEVKFVFIKQDSDGTFGLYNTFLENILSKIF